MSDNFLKFAIAEAERLEAALSALPLFQKLEAVRRTIAAYSVDAQPVPPRVNGAPDGGSRPKTERQSTRTGSQSTATGDLAKRYMSEVGHRVQTPELLAVLIERGAVIGGKNQKAALASLLSHHPEFDNIRGQGYGLKIWNGADKAPDPKSASQPHADNLDPEQEGEEPSPHTAAA